MNARALVIAALAVPLLGGGAPAASSSAGTAWLHVRIEDPVKQSHIRVNLPMPAVEAALKAAPDSIVLDGGTPLGHDMNLDRLRRLWKDLETAGDAEIVAVEGSDAREHIRKRSGRLLIHLQDDREPKVVDLDLPGPVVDALFSGGGDELNIRAAVPHLRTVRGEVLRVRDHDSTVRIWIDESVDVLEGE
jgi:hypothetical protein